MKKPSKAKPPLGRFKAKASPATTTYADIKKAADKLKADEYKKQQAALRATLAEKLRAAKLH